MAYDLEEQERLDELKAFWSRWGNWITLGLTLVLLVVAGWRGWGWWELRQASAASAIHEKMDDALRRAQLIEAAPMAATLMNEYSRTPYAAMAALRVARAQLDAGDSKSARTTLTWAVEHGQDPGIQAVARIRLAGLLLDEGLADRAQLDAGLKLLDGPPPAEMAGAWIDRRADLLAELGRGDEARAAWTEALSKLDSNSPLRPLVQLKLDTFGAGS